MKGVESVSDNMLLIRNIFQEATELASEILNDELLIQRLEENKTPYKSISYEATAMVRSLLDLKEGAIELPRFNQFLKKCPAHETQIYIGLGWAIAKQKNNPLAFLSAIDTMQLPRVLDGVGYCDGSFRQRISMQEKKIPEWITGDLIKGYHQGLGRSLWYVAKGDVAKLLELIQAFEENRKADMWRGVGIAVTYVCGCDESKLQTIFKDASTYQVHLQTGAVLAASSRFQANSTTNYLETVCKTWCGITLENALQLAEETKAIIQSKNYFEWLELLQQRLKC